MTDIPDKIYLSEDELPTQYCSLRADMKEKPPMLNPVTHEVMEPIFCKELIRQELDDSTPAKIYYKSEGNNTSGSHKLNSAAAQACYAKKQGLKGVTAETGTIPTDADLEKGFESIPQFPGNTL